MLSWIDSEWLGLCLAGYVVNWFGDSLDGSLARWRGIERPNYGYFVDHSVDALGTLLMVSAIGMSPYMRFDVALMAVIGYFLLSIHTFIAAKVVGEFRLSYMAGGPTELRLMLMAMTIAMPISGADIAPNFSASTDRAASRALVRCPVQRRDARMLRPAALAKHGDPACA